MEDINKKIKTTQRRHRDRGTKSAGFAVVDGFRK